MASLRLDGPQSPSQLAALLDITTASATELLDRLVHRGFITRTPQQLLHRLRPEFAYGVGDLGLIAAEAAFSDDGWLDAVTAAIAANLDLLGSLLADHLPAVTFHRPQAGFLAWLDFRATSAADDPAGPALERARVALSPGASFGPGGEGFARLNVGCHDDVLREAISRLATALG